MTGGPNRRVRLKYWLLRRWTQIVDWVDWQFVAVANWLWSIHTEHYLRKLRKMEVDDAPIVLDVTAIDMRELYCRPGRVIPVAGNPADMTEAELRSAARNKTYAEIYGASPEKIREVIDPVYRGETVGEPLPEGVVAPVMIPGLEPLLPRTQTPPAEVEHYAKTGRIPAFSRVVDDINPLAFQPVTGAKVRVSTAGTLGGWVVEVLVGENKEPFGFIYRRDGTMYYPTAAAARSAKSRFLKRLKRNREKLVSAAMYERPSMLEPTEETTTNV